MADLSISVWTGKQLRRWRVETNISRPQNVAASLLNIHVPGHIADTALVDKLPASHAGITWILLGHKDTF